MKLRAEDLVKKYKSRTVVKGVSVNVEQGEIVGLLGPNGAGKTTSFYMIVGLIKPNGGRIFLDDTEITTEPVYRRAQLGVGYLAQEASVFRRGPDCRGGYSEYRDQVKREKYRDFDYGPQRSGDFVYYRPGLSVV